MTDTVAGPFVRAGVSVPAAVRERNEAIRPGPRPHASITVYPTQGVFLTAPPGAVEPLRRLIDPEVWEWRPTTRVWRLRGSLGPMYPHVAKLVQQQIDALWAHGVATALDRVYSRGCKIRKFGFEERPRWGSEPARPEPATRERQPRQERSDWDRLVRDIGQAQQQEALW